MKELRESANASGSTTSALLLRPPLERGVDRHGVAVSQTEIAPRTEVRGIRYKTVQTSSVTPIPTMVDSRYPSRAVASITKGGLNSFMPPSISKNRTDSAVRMRLAQIRRSETPAFSILIRF